MTIKIIRTSRLNVLKTWLIGGQVDGLGGHAEGFQLFEARHNPKTYPKDLTETKEVIDHLITEYADEPSNGPNRSFVYYGDYYKFKMPSATNLARLACRVWDEIREANEEYERDE